MGARQAVALGGAALGALAALNAAIASAPKPPEQPMQGPSERYDWHEGSVRYTVNGAGAPLLLLHGIGIAASSFEMRYIAEPLARHFRVVAPDLLGFGLSDRPAIRYDAELYVRLLGDFLRDVVGGGAAVIAAGPSASFAIEVAAREPERVAALICSAPPPLERPGRLHAQVERAAEALLAVPVLGQSLFNGLSSRGTIRSYLRDRAYNNPDLVTESMVDAHYAMARQPNARYAVHAYLAGRLQLDCAAALATMRQRLLLVYGAGQFPPPSEQAAAYVRGNPRADVLILERCSALPHEEQAEAFAAAATAWLGA